MSVKSSIDAGIATVTGSIFFFVQQLGLARANELVYTARVTDDHKEGLAAFAEKRKGQVHGAVKE